MIAKSISTKIGIKLSKSIGSPTLGSELNDGYNFPDMSAYSLSLAVGHTATAINNELNFYLPDNNFSRIYTTIYEVGKRYRIVYNITDEGYSGAIRIRLPLSSGANIAVNAAGVYQYDLVAETTFGGFERNLISAPVAFKCDLFSIREIL